MTAVLLPPLFIGHGQQGRYDLTPTRSRFTAASRDRQLRYHLSRVRSGRFSSSIRASCPPPPLNKSLDEPTAANLQAGYLLRSKGLSPIAQWWTTQPTRFLHRRDWFRDTKDRDEFLNWGEEEWNSFFRLLLKFIRDGWNYYVNRNMVKRYIRWCILSWSKVSKFSKIDAPSSWIEVIYLEIGYLICILHQNISLYWRIN